MANAYPSNQTRIGVGPGPYLVGQKVETNSATGNKSTWTYEGSIAEVQSQRETDLLNGAATTEIAEKGDGNYRLTTVWNYDLITGSGSSAIVDLPANVHDLQASMETVSVYNSVQFYQSLLAAFGGSDSSAKNAQAAVHAAVDYFNGHTDPMIDPSSNRPVRLILSEMIITGGTYTDPLGTTFTDNGCYPSNATAQALMLSLFRNIALMGIETVPEWNSIYRRSITAASPLQVQASRVGEGQIWTSAEVAAFENLPAFWWFTLPSVLQWMKSPVEVNMVAGGKTRIDYHYIGFKQASGLFYTAYGAATLLP